MDEALIKQKRLTWSRSLRDEARSRCLAARDSLRALYDQIDLKRAQFLQAREELGEAYTRVKKYRSELRDLCLRHELPDDHRVCQDANSSDVDHDVDSITEPESADEDLM